jgi:hypothetical protein
MSANFRISSQYQNGEMVILLKGDFDGSSAWELVNTIHERYTGEGRIMIDTDGIKHLVPFGIATFKCRLDPNKVPLDRLVFRGEKGLEISPEGCRVITGKNRGLYSCGGRCENCNCRVNDHDVKTTWELNKVPGDPFHRRRNTPCPV